jgi:hypothetical protein
MAQTRISETVCAICSYRRNRRNELPAGSGSKSRSKKAEKAEVKKAEKTAEKKEASLFFCVIEWQCCKKTHPARGTCMVGERSVSWGKISEF